MYFVYALYSVNNEGAASPPLPSPALRIGANFTPNLKYMFAAKGCSPLCGSWQHRSNPVSSIRVQNSNLKLYFCTFSLEFRTFINFYASCYVPRKVCDIMNCDVIYILDLKLG
jgi:hypothetical protein